MNDQKVNPRKCVKDSMEASGTFPVYRDKEQELNSQWLKLLKELIKTKH